MLVIPISLISWCPQGLAGSIPAPPTYAGITSVKLDFISQAGWCDPNYRHYPKAFLYMRKAAPTSDAILCVPVQFRLWDNSFVFFCGVLNVI